MYVLRRPINDMYLGSWFSEWLHQPFKNLAFPMAVVGGLTLGGATGLLPTTGTFGVLGQTGNYLWGGVKSIGSMLVGSLKGGGAPSSGGPAPSPTTSAPSPGLLPTIWSAITSAIPSAGEIAAGATKEYIASMQPQPVPTTKTSLEQYMPMIAVGGVGIVLLLLLTRK